jgi:hypothetical protein
MLTSTILGGASWVAEWLTSAALQALWFVPGDKPAWQAIPLGAVLAATVVTGIAWQQSRARARRRWLAALDAFAEREIERERRRRALERLRELSMALGIPGGTDDRPSVNRLAV